MENYTTVVEAIDGLRKQGYVEDLNLRHSWLDCRDGSLQIHHDEFHIDKFFRFEGDTDPSDEAIVYAISSEKHDLKGVLVNGYGISAEALANEMLEKLR